MVKVQLTMREKLARKVFKTITAGKFLTYKQYTKQTDENGNTMLKKYRVDELQNGSIEEALDTANSIPVITKEGMILAGNHRYEALKNKVAQLKERKDKKALHKLLGEKFQACFFVDTLTPLEMLDIAIESNMGNSKTNFRSLAMTEDLPISEKVYKPILKALIKAQKEGDNYSKNCFKSHRLYQIVMLIAGCFEEHPEYVELLAKGEAVPITGADMYKARSSMAGGEHFKDIVEVKCDLRPYVNKLKSLFEDGCKSIMRLRDRGIWKDMLEGNRNFEYVLIGLSLQGELFFNLDTTHAKKRENLKPFTYRYIESIISGKIDKFMPKLLLWQLNPAKTEGSLRRMFDKNAKSAKQLASWGEDDDISTPLTDKKKEKKMLDEIKAIFGEGIPVEKLEQARKLFDKLPKQGLSD